jgi:hypothetical protein
VIKEEQGELFALNLQDNTWFKTMWTPQLTETGLGIKSLPSSNGQDDLLPTEKSFTLTNMSDGAKVYVGYTAFEVKFDSSYGSTLYSNYNNPILYEEPISVVIEEPISVVISGEIGCLEREPQLFFNNMPVEIKGDEHTFLGKSGGTDYGGDPIYFMLEGSYDDTLLVKARIVMYTDADYSNPFREDLFTGRFNQGLLSANAVQIIMGGCDIYVNLALGN